MLEIRSEANLNVDKMFSVSEFTSLMFYGWKPLWNAKNTQFPRQNCWQNAQPKFIHSINIQFIQKSVNLFQLFVNSGVLPTVRISVWIAWQKNQIRVAKILVINVWKCCIVLVIFPLKTNIFLQYLSYLK